MNELSPQESLLNDSRITPTGNGNDRPCCIQPSNGQKWWAAVLIGLVFALISSPVAYILTSRVSRQFSDIALMIGPGPNFYGLLIHTLIFIAVIRVILW